MAIVVMLVLVGRCQGKGKLQLANVLGDSMVLQATPLPWALWGSADGEVGGVRVEVDGVEASAVVAETRLLSDGSGGWFWRVVFAPRAASKVGGEASVVTVRSNQGSVVLKDVLFGDVFLCSGQSNMQMGASALAKNDSKIAAVTRDQIRVMTLEGFPQHPQHAASNSSMESLHATEIQRPWAHANSDSVLGPDRPWPKTYFSAVCLFFGIEVSERRNVPVGLVSASTAGATIEYFCDKETLQQCQRAHPFQHHGVTLGPIGKEGGVIWSNMLVPLTLMPFRAFLFYQGEANGWDSAAYECTFPAMIKQWRREFGPSASQGALERADIPTRHIPFLFVQIAPDKRTDKTLAKIRLAQLSAVKLPAVGCVPAYDLGDNKSPLGPIHPRWKREIGERLERQSRRLVYHQAAPLIGLDALPPMLESVAIFTGILSKAPVNPGGVYESEWVLSQASPTEGAAGEVSWVANLTIGSFEMIRASGTRGCEACCTMSPLDLLLEDKEGHRQSTAMMTVASGIGWYAAAAKVPPGFEAAGLANAYSDYPQCALWAGVGKMPMLPFRLERQAAAPAAGSVPLHWRRGVRGRSSSPGALRTSHPREDGVLAEDV